MPDNQADLLDIDEVCAFFGGTRPLNPSTIYRGVGKQFPSPVKVGPNNSRWLRSECEAALREMAASRRKGG
jgi:predicted DNA-binding transcriptional regulator AlpA